MGRCFISCCLEYELYIITLDTKILERFTSLRLQITEFCAFIFRHRSALSPIEVANAVAAAKQASQNVLIAQQQVQVAKENVLNQQRLAAEKETHATILNQKKAAESADAAHSVVLAQQRLAAAKNAVAHQQRIAAAKEAHAVSALQNSPNVAYAEIQRTGKNTVRYNAKTDDINKGTSLMQT